MRMKKQCTLTRKHVAREAERDREARIQFWQLQTTEARWKAALALSEEYLRLLGAREPSEFRLDRTKGKLVRRSAQPLDGVVGVKQ